MSQSVALRNNAEAFMQNTKAGQNTNVICHPTRPKLMTLDPAVRAGHDVAWKIYAIR